MTTPGSGEPPWGAPDEPPRYEPTAPLPPPPPPPPPSPAGYGYPAPAYAQSQYAGPYPPVPPPPLPPRGGNRAALIAVAAVVVVAAAAIALVFALGSSQTTQGNASATQSRSGAASGFPSTFGDQSTTSAPTPSSAIAVADARAVVVHYIDDINAQNRSDAKSLICTELADQWQATIDVPGGDFTVTVTKATFMTYRASSEGVDLDYSLNVKSIDTGQTGVSAVTFTVVDDGNALRICGES